MCLVTTCNIWSRMLYDFYVSNDITPVVLDADDYLSDNAYVKAACDKLGLDQSRATFSWPAITEREKSEMHRFEYTSAKYLFESTGVDESRATRNINLAKEEDGWDSEFGEDAELVREMVSLAMPHYQYLCERRFKL